jgi:hypothetical protein
MWQEIIVYAVLAACICFVALKFRKPAAKSRDCCKSQKGGCGGGGGGGCACKCAACPTERQAHRDTHPHSVA